MWTGLRGVGLRWGAVLVGAAGTLGCSPEQLQLAEQCPSPESGQATVAGDQSTQPSGTFGTTCAPCDDEDQPELDDRGCPVFVTAASCGGDVCIGSVRIPRQASDGGALDGGAGPTADGGASDEDGGEEDSGA